MLELDVPAVDAVDDVWRSVAGRTLVSSTRGSQLARHSAPRRPSTCTRSPDWSA